MTSLDTNVMLRLFLNDVPAQTKKAQEMIDKNDDIYLTDVVVVEIIFVLEKTMNIDREIICGLFKDLLSTKIVHSHLVPAAISKYENYPALSIVDCYAATETEVYHNQLVTFDKKLAVQGGDHVTLL
jgi:predicted nucleic-acid-binding protein